MKLYVSLGMIDEHDAVDELKKEQNMKPNMPDRGKALEAAPEKDVTGISVDPAPSARAEEVEAPVNEPDTQDEQATEPAEEPAEETAAEPVQDTVGAGAEAAATEDAEDEKAQPKKTRTKKSKK